MEECGALNPGCKAFWDHFYEEDTGRLAEKEAANRKSKEVKERGSLLDYYEWFMPFDKYEDLLLDFLKKYVFPCERHFRVLHIGCGNSDFSDRFSEAVQSCVKTVSTTVLNTDISEDLIDRLQLTYTNRLYAVGNCCQMLSSEMEEEREEEPHGDEDWYQANPRSLLVFSSSVTLIFDKGTMDALLSSYPGDYNPNAANYASEAIRVLAPGGAWFLISINSEDTIDSYVLSSSFEEKSFRRVFTDSIQLTPQEVNEIRVETLGSLYHLYGYTVVNESD